jgi:Haem-binding domain
MARTLQTIALLAVAVGASIQLVNVQHASAPPTGDLSAPPQVESALRRACYDCHSNETRWPWYSRVAPVSWLIARDVERGRRELNFSEWASYYPATRKRKLEWMQRVLREQEMPKWSYRLIHSQARLTDADREIVDRWIRSEITAFSAASSNGASSK